MRAHGVPNYPDPGSSGGIVKETAQQLGVGSSQLQAALDACQHLLPEHRRNDRQRYSAAALHQAWWSRDECSFARCMHSHGVPNWPDPTDPRAPYPQDHVPRSTCVQAGIGIRMGAPGTS